MWKNILSVLETELETPKPYGIYHMGWVVATIVVIIYLVSIRKKHNEKQLKYVLGTYGVIALILEALKQLIWSVEYDNLTSTFVLDYQWYAFPFQLCTMPIYVCVICLFLRKSKVRDCMLSFVAYTTILGSIASAIIPHDLFVSDVLINIHAMWLHLGSLVVSIYLLASKEVKINIQSLLNGLKVFLIAAIIANTLNIIVYNSGVLNGETFNMFYISPYFESSLPVFNNIYNMVPYLIFVVIYIIALSLGSYLVFSIATVISRIKIVKRNTK